mmetsp:Transcript_55563/g.102816  ORF Transcript_55563/g.102816 Transcript_55563/m.102816 type:complete len:248 (+) Transcript_55563:2-745(+)
MHLSMGVILILRSCSVSCTGPPARDIIPVIVTHVLCLWWHTLIAASRHHILYIVLVRCLRCGCWHQPRRLVHACYASTRHVAPTSELCCYHICLSAALCSASLSFGNFSFSFPLGVLPQAVTLLLPHSSLAPCLLFLECIFLAFSALALDGLSFLLALFLLQPFLFSSLLFFISSFSVFFLAHPPLLFCGLSISSPLLVLQLSLALQLKCSLSLLLLSPLSCSLSISHRSPLCFRRIFLLRCLNNSF